jgi:hypothetical protein
LEDLVFHNKSRTEQLQDQSASLASSAANVAEQLRERVGPAVEQAAESAMERVGPHVEAARLWAKPRVEHGIEVAAPKLESVVSGLAPKVDSARDKIVDEVLPRLTEAINAFAAASAAVKEEAVSRSTGAAAVISGDAYASPKRKKKGRVMLILGLLTAAVAGVAAFMRNSAPKDDPWATPLGDPYIAPSTGRHASVAPGEGTKDATPSADSAGTTPAMTDSVDGTGVDGTAVSDPAGPAAETNPATEDDKDAGSKA